MNKTVTTTRRGFSLVELLVVLAIIAVLASIISVGIARGVSGARAASEKAFCASLKLACEQFKQQFGFLPPVMDDGIDYNGPNQLSVPMVPVENQPVLYDIVGLSTNNGSFETIFSTNTLAYYLVGAADKSVDGVDGPGFTFPVDKTPTHSQEGHFSRKGQTYPALIDAGKNRQRLQHNPYEQPGSNEQTPSGTYWILDRWDRPFRYYRWMPSYYQQGDNNSDKSLWGTVRSTNIPGAVWRTLANGNDRLTANDFPELRDGGFAIVSAGPDGNFGEGDTQAAKDNIVEIGQ